MSKTSKIKIYFLMIPCILGIILSCSSCIPLVLGAAAGAGGIIWAKGALQQEFNKPVDRVYRATKIALKKLDLPIQVDKKDNLTAKIESEFADGKHVWIDITYISKYTSKVSIRVGPLGDEIKSREISETIIKYL